MASNTCFFGSLVLREAGQGHFSLVIAVNYVAGHVSHSARTVSCKPVYFSIPPLLCEVAQKLVAELEALRKILGIGKQDRFESRSGRCCNRLLQTTACAAHLMDCPFVELEANLPLLCNLVEQGFPCHLFVHHS